MFIKKKIIISLVVAAIIPIIIVGTLSFLSAEKALKNTRIAALESITDLKAESLENYFDTITKDITAITENLNLENAISILVNSPAEPPSSTGKEVKGKMGKTFTVVQQIYKFSNIIITNAKGEIIYALGTSDAAANLENAYLNAEGRNVSDKGKGVYFLESYIGDSKANQSGMFAVTPLYDHRDTFIGEIIFKFPMESIYTLIGDTTGLGETGETLLATRTGNSVLFLNPLRHDANATLRRKVPMGEREAIPIQEALSGRNGQGFSIDYRGEEVLAVWRYIPSMQWGMVAKIDVSEAFSSVATLRMYVTIVLLATILIATLIAQSLARTIADPIHSLHKGVKELGSGNLDYKIDARTDDEIGQLGKAFDQMTDDLKVITASRDELEKEVDMRKESEKRFRTLVENSLSGLSIIQDEEVVYQNREQERLLGPLPRSPKFKDIDTIYPDDVEKVKNYYHEVPLNNFPMRDIDFRFYPQSEKRNYQDLIWVHCRSVPIEYQGKEAILVNMTDITPIKQMEHLLRMQDKMESLGRIASGVAHEIRNPLSGVNVFLDGIKENFEDPDNAKDIKDLIDQAKGASNKIESIVKRVLDFSRPSLPKLELKDINKPIKEAFHLSHVSLRKAGIEIELNLSDAIRQVHIDAQLIEQVLLNMITNAAEALKDIQGRKVIAITSSMEKDSVFIMIGDSGPGVEPDIREKIFDPFYTTRTQGSGIGLSICQRIISDHGGLIEISESELGGAEFIIKIPQQSA